MSTKIFDLIPLTRENIKAGMVIRVPASDGSVHVFNDTVIESIQGEIVHLVRPYCFLKNGVVHCDQERSQISMEMIFRTMGANRWFYVLEGSVPAQVHERT